MNELILSSSTFGVALSLLGYLIGTALKKRFPHPLVNPMIIAIAFVMIFLVVFRIDYQVYNESAKYLSWFLTPATICLAVPLYTQLQKLRENLLAVACAIVSGVATSLLTIFALSWLFGLSHPVFVSLLPKSVTAAIGIGIAEELGGDVSLTMAGIMMTGLFGNLSADLVCRLFRITESIAKGLAIGTTSHAIGTAKAMEWSELSGAMASLALVITGLLSVLGASVLAELYPL